jgi:hypothetical protein
MPKPDLFAPYVPDLFDKPGMHQEAQIPAGTVFTHGGRPLLVHKVHGTDAAAPVIVEELTNAVTLKGQLGLWGADGVRRALRK